MHLDLFKNTSEEVVEHCLCVNEVADMSISVNRTRKKFMLDVAILFRDELGCDDSGNFLPDIQRAFLKQRYEKMAETLLKMDSEQRIQEASQGFWKIILNELEQIMTEMGI